mmetsp:Transcript_872/g.2996  ORF Transcript_872/g.2996 Transcript_872/m.2996 type:complete len:86 (-) Transcript_872:261-518(-)
MHKTKKTPFGRNVKTFVCNMSKMRSNPIRKSLLLRASRRAPGPSSTEDTPKHMQNEKYEDNDAKTKKTPKNTANENPTRCTEKNP